MLYVTMLLLIFQSLMETQCCVEYVVTKPVASTMEYMPVKVAR